MDEAPPPSGRGDEPLAVLAGFGLSGYMARAYLALLELGPSQAREVSERSGVPQGRVYDILEKLHQRGLAEVLPEAPRRYQAVPFETFLERELQMHRDRVGTLERDRAGLVDALRRVQAGAAPPERGEYLVLRGRKNLLERVTGLHAGAQRDVLAIGTERSPLRLKAQEGGAPELVARGGRLRVLAPVTPANAEAVRALLAAGAEVRHHGALAESLPAGLNVLVADGQRAMLYQHIPDEPDGLRGEDVGLFIEHPEMVRGLQALAESLWSIATPAGDRLAELARGEVAGERQTVLLVEDEPDVLHSLRELLERSLEGVQVRAVENAPAGLDVLKAEPVDLIITDYKLPGMNGLEFLDQAAKLAPGVQRILITAFPDLKVAIRAINEASVEHFLTKPFQSRQVVNIVRAVLSERRERALRNRLLAQVPLGGEPPKPAAAPKP